MICKSRVLNSDLGMVGDSLEYPWAGSVTNGASPYPLTQQFYDNGFEKFHIDTKALRYNVGKVHPTYVGLEEFSATERPRPSFNDCIHTKAKYLAHPFAIWYEALGNPNYINMKGFSRMVLPSGSTKWDKNVAHLAQYGDFEDARRRAWWSMQPRFEGEVSMLNFIFELKDFRSLVKAFIKMRSPSLLAKQMRIYQANLRKLNPKLGHASRTVAELTSKKLGPTLQAGMSTARIIAQLRLLNEFAIKPLMADTANILSQIGVIVEEAQAKFMARGVEPQVSHFSETVVHTDTLKLVSPYLYWYKKGLYVSTTFTATLEYKYNYMLRSQTDAFLKYWGLKPNAEAIWNAIPFSFLADYFYKIGDAIHSMTLDPNVALMHTQYCESLLFQYVSGYAYTGDSRAKIYLNEVSNPRYGTPITAYFGSHYRRRLTSPNMGLATPKFSLPSGRQGANMAALAMCFIK